MYTNKTPQCWPAHECLVPVAYAYQASPEFRFESIICVIVDWPEPLLFNNVIRTMGGSRKCGRGVLITFLVINVFHRGPYENLDPTWSKCF